MSSISTQQRNKMKAVNPQKYAEYLEKQRIRSKNMRDRRKEKWKNEPLTSEQLKQYEREKELTRLRVSKYRSKGAPERTTKNSKTDKTESKKPKDMTKKERKEHKRKLQQKYRARQTAEKKQEIREKDRAYHKAKKAGLIKEEVTNIRKDIKSNCTQELRNEKKREIQEMGELILECDEEVTNITMEELKSNFTQELSNEKEQDIQETGALILECDEEVTMEELKSNFTQELRDEIKQEIQETDEAIYSTPLSEQQKAKRKYFKWSSFVYKKEKMSSISTQQRHKMKAVNPQKYAKYLERQRIRSKNMRDRRKEKWRNEPLTQELLKQYEREKELTRLRVRKYRSKSPPERTTKNSKTDKTESKKPKDMTKKERKEHKRKLQQKYRARQTAEKKQEIREKDRAYHKAKKAGLIKVKHEKVPKQECT